MMQEKFLSTTGVGGGRDPGEHTLGLAAPGQDHTSILAAQVCDNPEKSTGSEPP